MKEGPWKVFVVIKATKIADIELQCDNRLVSRDQGLDYSELAYFN